MDIKSRITYAYA